MLDKIIGKNPISIVEPLIKGSNFIVSIENQCIYRKFYNTSHGIIPVIETICETFNIGHHGAVVMADFEGAFDAMLWIVNFTKQVLKGCSWQFLTASLQTYILET